MSSVQITMAMAIVTLALAMGLLTIIVNNLQGRVLELEEKLEDKNINIRINKKVID